jgi:rRNA biogenesis protein RRP5
MLLIPVEWLLLRPLFHPAGEVDAARQVAERALRTIAMTSERDKFNVWVALMNLENAYGGAQAEDAIMGVFKR